MKFISSLFIIGFLFCTFLGIAQPLLESSRELNLEAAAEQIDLNNYYNALELYKEAYKEQKDLEIAIEIAYLNYKTRNYKRAATWYAKVFKKDKTNYYGEDRFLYGKSLKALGKFQDARTELRRFVEETDDPEAKSMAILELQGIQASQSMEDNIEAVIKFGGKNINKGQSESSPKLYEDGKTLYYSAIASNKLIETQGNNEKQYSHIYSAVIGEGGAGKGQDLGEHINRPGYHSSNPSFSADGRKMYFTRGLLDGNVLAESMLYVSYQTDEGWKPPVEVSSLNGDFIIKHPTVGELYGKQVLYFVSNMDGGKGGFDIYYANMKSDDGFSEPVNLGDKINTMYDEVSPFYHDGVFYFSTDGRPGLGGYDIFKTEWDGSQWSEPMNLGFNYNTTYDDWYFFLNKGGSRGYLVSNRPDKNKKKLKSLTCCDDIYSIEVREMVIDLDLYVMDADGPLNGAEAKLIDQSGAVEAKTKGNSLGNNIKFLLDADRSYGLTVKRDGYISDTIMFNTAGIIDDHTVQKEIVLIKIPEPEPIVEIVKINEVVRLNNIYYDFDKADILPDAEKDLNVILGLLERYDNMVIELASHTDAQGVSKYNTKLSQRRADSAKKWLVDRGVSSQSIKAVGYGEKQILNHCVNGVKCSDEEHRFNRRTEFKVLEGPASIEIIREQPVEVIEEEIEIDFDEDDDIDDYNRGGVQNYRQDSFPKMKFDAPVIEVGEITEGMHVELIYNFVNVGDTELVIELVTACKCTKLEWPVDPVPPGGIGEIIVEFDSTGFKGDVHKTVDIISNTDPIVQEVKFDVTVLSAE